MLPISIILFLVFCYFLGSIPSGFVIGKVFKGIDVRNYGSGKTGATNVLRTVGVGAGILSFILDLAKSAGAVLLSGWFASKSSEVSIGIFHLHELLRVSGGVMAIVGHNWPIYLKFKGGRGVVATMGAFIVLSPISALVATVIAFTSISIWRFVSLGSILGAITIALMLTYQYFFVSLAIEILIFGISSMLMIILQHMDNISRLYHGTERKLGQKAENI